MPLRPPIMYFPFKLSNVKFSMGSLDTMNDPSLLVRPANVIG